MTEDGEITPLDEAGLPLVGCVNGHCLWEGQTTTGRCPVCGSETGLLIDGCALPSDANAMLNCECEHAKHFDSHGRYEAAHKYGEGKRFSEIKTERGSFWVCEACYTGCHDRVLPSTSCSTAWMWRDSDLRTPAEKRAQEYGR